MLNIYMPQNTIIWAVAWAVISGILALFLFKKVRFFQKPLGFVTLVLAFLAGIFIHYLVYIIWAIWELVFVILALLSLGVAFFLLILGLLEKISQKKASTAKEKK